jgi:hypothetical protein
MWRLMRIGGDARKDGQKGKGKGGSGGVRFRTGRIGVRYFLICCLGN